MKTAVGVLSAVVWLLWLLCLCMYARSPRTPRARMQRARTMPAKRLGDERAVQIAERIVYAAWLNSGQRWP